MYETTELVAQGFRVGAPTEEVEAMDAMVVERRPCRKCGGAMEYRGYHKPNGRFTEYIAMAICGSCNHRVYI